LPLVLVPQLVLVPRLVLVPLVLLQSGPVGLALEPAWLRAQALGQAPEPQPAERKSGTSRWHACHRHTADRS
jgi:hypothetical protein